MSQAEGVAVCVGAALGLSVASFVAPQMLSGALLYMFYGAFGAAGMLGGFAVNRLLEREESGGEEA